MFFYTIVNIIKSYLYWYKLNMKILYLYIYYALTAYLRYLFLGQDGGMRTASKLRLTRIQHLSLAYGISHALDIPQSG